MTVLVYVDTSKQVGDHIKVFANAEAVATWFAEKAWRWSMRFWNERGRPLSLSVRLPLSRK